MLIVHHLENSRSQRVLWLLEELGVAYEVKRYQRDKTTYLAPKELLAVHPLGKSPVVEDGAIYAETGAIMEHILEKYGAGRLEPTRGTDEWRRYRYWMHAAEGSYMPALTMALIFGRLETAPMPFFAKPVARRIVAGVREGYLAHTTRALFQFLDAELGKSTFLAGADLTAADIMMSFPAEAALSRIEAASGAKHIKAYVGRLQARPAYKRALERGGPYAYA